jgi:hypothetical protein
MGLIDYSILLIKVDRKSLTESFSENKKEYEESYLESLKSEPAVMISHNPNENQVYYHIGLIDYL